MKLRKYFTCILAAGLLLQSLCFGGCTNKGDEPEDKQDGELLKYWLQWYTTGARAEELKRPDGTYPSWDWLTAKDMGINLMHVIFTPEDENGELTSGMPNTSDLLRHCEKMQYEIEQTHNSGIKLIAFSTDVQFKEKETLKMGYTVEELAAVKNGQPVVDFAWDPEGTYIACINSPEWRQWCKENVKAIAQAGFDGLQYDYGPYAAVGGNCECEHCKKSWAEYSEKVLGEEKQIPGTELDFTKKEDREYLNWKVKCLADFFSETLEDAKAVNPDFIFIMNESVMSNTFPSLCLSGVYDMTSSEYWGVDCGNESSLFMYALNEALGYDNLLGIFNSEDQITPEYRLKVALAESYAVNGGISFSFSALSAQFASFVNEYPELYLGTESKAETAVIFSAQSALFSGSGNDPAVAAGKQLGYAKVPFDFIVIEKDDAVNSLKKYKTVVIPDFKYFGDGWKPFVRKLLLSGKNIIVIGEKSEEYFKDFLGSKKSKVQYIESASMLHKSLAKTSAYSLIADDSEYYGSGELEFTVRSFGEKYDVIHAIRMGSPASAVENAASFTYDIPKGKTVSSVTAFSPYTDSSSENGFEIPVTWTVSKGKIHITTEAFDTYCVIKTEY